MLHLNCKGKFLRETNYWTKRIWTRNLEEMVLYLISQDENNNVLAILSHVFLNLQKQLTGRQIPKRNPTMYVQDDVRKIAAANSSRKFCLIRSWYLIHPKSWVYTKYRVLFPYLLNRPCENVNNDPFIQLLYYTLDTIIKAYWGTWFNFGAKIEVLGPKIHHK